MLNGNKIPGGGFKREVLEPDVYSGRVVMVIDCGLQAQRPFKGQDKAPANEIMFTYELSEEFMHDEDGEELKDKPRWVSETMPLYNLGADKAKSTLRYRALDPNNEYDGDFSRLLEVPCNITIVVDEGKGKNIGKRYENIANVAPMSSKKAEKLPPLVNEAKFFDLDNPDLVVFNSLSKWIQDKIKANLNFNGSVLQKLLGEQVKENAEIKSKPEPSDEDERPY